MTATGLFVEHYQKYNVIWNGENGKTIFFQNELPYDPPNQAAWQHDGVLGWAAYKVADRVKTHELWGGGSYIFTNVDPTIHAAHGFEVPVTPGVQLHDLLTVNLQRRHDRPRRQRHRRAGQQRRHRCAELRGQLTRKPPRGAPARAVSRRGPVALVTEEGMSRWLGSAVVRIVPPARNPGLRVRSRSPRDGTHPCSYPPLVNLRFIPLKAGHRR